MTATAQTVEQEVMKAYADCHGNRPFNETEKERDLNFRASQLVTRDEAIRILSKAVPRGYNNFHASLLKHLPKDSMIAIAREGSPAIYVTASASALVMRIEAMDTDEWDTQANATTRIWWD